MFEHELSHQFEDLDQQHQAAQLGMWAFLATEVLFFGGMFVLYTVYRIHYPDVFEHGSRLMDLTLGAINTGVLLTSSLTMALGVRSASLGGRGRTAAWLLLTVVLGIAFLFIKGVEYHHKFVEHLVPGPYFSYDGPQPREMQMFFSLYFLLTGFHALHMIIGIVVVTIIAFLAARGKFSARYSNPVEIVGLYWHFVDLVWIFLFPLLYLVGSR